MKSYVTDLYMNILRYEFNEYKYRRKESVRVRVIRPFVLIYWNKCNAPDIYML